jgi:hypothetical protein
VSAIVTEKGVMRPPFNKTLGRIWGKKDGG